jgi:outer membrane protein TolC
MAQTTVEAPAPFSGSVASGKATGAEIPLTLQDAIERGLKYNLGAILGEQGTRAAEAAKARVRSTLLPNLSAGVTESGQQLSLKAFGFSSFPGLPTIVGPFNLIDARAFLSQPVLDLAALRNNRAASESLKAAQFSYANARDVVVLAVAGLYLQAIAGSSRIAAAEAQVTTAQALYDQAVDMHKAGTSPGIEVIRSQVELQAEQQRLIFFKNEFEKQKLSLARAIGLPLEQQFSLADQIPYTPLAAVTYEQALEQAYASRADYQNAQALVRAAEYARSAAAAGRLPSVSFDANYGAIGPRPYDAHGTFTAAGSVRMPLFEGGRIRSEVLQADALLEQRKSESEELRGRIDYEVRTAFLDLKAAGDQVQVARSAADLANQQMSQSRDRFAAGVTNSVEVVQSQGAVATASENYISSLFAYNLAKATLARSVGAAERRMKEFLGVGR